MPGSRGRRRHAGHAAQLSGDVGTGPPLAAPLRAGPDGPPSGTRIGSALQLAVAAHDPEATGPKIDVSPDRTVSVLDLATPFSGRSEKGADSLHELRENLAPAGVPYVTLPNTAGGLGANEEVVFTVQLSNPHGRRVAIAGMAVARQRPAR